MGAVSPSASPLFAVDEITQMEQEMPGSIILDLYEEMLYKRAMKGIRPMLYVSSPKDLECSVQLLLEEGGETKLGGRPRLAGRRFKRRL
jgi:hypothetical protein